MLIRFFPHGQGSGKEAVDYVLDSVDHKGGPREQLTVLRGDPQMVGDVIDTITRVERYTSGAFSWAPEDAPTDAEISESLDLFERVAFAGLEPQQYTWSAVLHRRSGGAVDVHFIVARTELTTGKAMNIAPPRIWEAWATPLQSHLNFKHGWARPDDPARARVAPPGRRKPENADQARAQMTQEVLDGIAAGTITTRDDVLTVLQQYGEMNRISRRYVSVRLPDLAKPVRLEGPAFLDVIDVAAIKAALVRDATSVKRERAEPDLAAAARALAAFDQRVEARATYNRKRYELPGLRLEPAPRPVVARAAAPTDVADIEQELIDDRDRNVVAERLRAADGAARAGIEQARDRARSSVRTADSELQRARGSLQRADRACRDAEQSARRTHETVRNRVATRGAIEAADAADHAHWRQRRLQRQLERYGAQSDLLGRYWPDRVRSNGSVVYENRTGRVVDEGPRVTAASGSDREIDAMIELARLKNWRSVRFHGAADFKLRAMKAALAANLAVAPVTAEDVALLARARAERIPAGPLDARRTATAAATASALSLPHPRATVAAAAARRSAPKPG